MLNLKSKLFTFKRASAFKAAKVSQYWPGEVMVKILTKVKGMITLSYLAEVVKGKALTSWVICAFDNVLFSELRFVATVTTSGRVKFVPAV